MGIKNYISYFTNSYPDIICKKTKKPIDILCIDTNSILHEICEKSKNKQEFKNQLYNKLNKLVKKLNPKKIALFVDGQAVLAKAETQIKRRYKHLYSTTEFIDTLNLTPGTLFMDFVDEIIPEYLKSLKIETYYSSSKENNEGEFKLFQWLKKIYVDGTICIYGNDADLIVLALINKPLLNLYIYNGKQFISLFNLIKSLSELTGYWYDFKTHPIRNDVGLISLLVGNDYNSSISSINNLINAYIDILYLNYPKKVFLVRKDGSINLKNMRLLFEKLSEDQYSDNKLYSNTDVKKYFQALSWNFELYKGVVNPLFIPDYKINLNTILHYFPKYIDSIQTDYSWIEKDINTLLIMPRIGINLIPEKLRKYMKDDSPIIDLFPVKCNECLHFKTEISLINSKIDLLQEKEFKILSSLINKNYKKHLDDFHSVNIKEKIQILRKYVID